MNKLIRTFYILAFDTVLIFFAQIISYSMRYEKIIIFKFLEYLSTSYFFIFLISYIFIFFIFKFRDISHRFFTIDQSRYLFLAFLFLGMVWISFPILLQLNNYPRSIGALTFINFIFLFYASRILINKLLNLKNYRTKNVIFIGFNNKLYDLILAYSQKSKIKSILVEEKSQFIKKNILGVRLININEIFNILDKNQIDEVIIDKQMINHPKVNELFLNLNRYSAKILTMDPNNVSIDNIQQVELNDIIFKGITNLKFTGSFNEKDVILVTGGVGSIGSSIIREINKSFPSTKIICLDISEFQTYLLENELNNKNIKYVIGDINDNNLVSSVIKKYNVNTIFHAAAYKHVPIMEENIYQSFINNCKGTLNLVNNAISLDIKKFIFISSDKAVRPTNIMGLSKRISESIIDHHQQMFLNKKTNTLFCIVRFGNVLESSGSLIPLLRNQIMSGGPVTITHPEVTRYFMTLAEASHLVIESSFLTKGKEVYLFDMGNPMKILDLAKRMINLYGHQIKSNDDEKGIKISFIGLRPGEKMYEELLVDDKSIKTVNTNIFISDESRIDSNNYKKYISFIEKIDNYEVDINLLRKTFDDEYTKYNFK